MGLFDDLLEEEERTQYTPPRRRGLFDDLLGEEAAPISRRSTQWTPPQFSPFKKKKPQEGFFRQAADVPVGLAKGAAQGVRMFTDILGADNPVSQGIRGVEDYLGNLMSAQAKEDQQEIARIMQEAEDKGVLDQVMAGVKAFSVAPVDLTVQALGTMAPVVIGGLAAHTAKLVATGIRGGAAAARGLTTGQAVATQAGVGLGTGAGVVKGTIYDEVKNELISQGLSEEAAHQEAVKAQEYGGKNLDQILLGAGLGAAAATTGAEKIVRGILTKTGVDATKSRVVNALQTGITEAIPEAAQGAQEQLAANVALQREGMEVPTMRGVFSSGALEGIAGFGVGAPLGAIQKASVAEDAARKAEEADAPQTANAIRKEAQQTVAAEKAVVQEEQDIEDTEKEMVPIQEEYKVPAKEEFKTTFAKMSPESIAQTEQGFREELENEDADTRAFAQAGLDALVEFRAGVAPTPITVPPVEEVAPAVAAVTQPAAPAAPVTPAAPAEPVAAPAEPITSADAQVINNLRSVADNTANREQISALSAAGLVDIIKGQPVINEDGEALLAQAQAPLPRLTPAERVAEIQAAPPPAAPTVEAPAIVEQEPTISEEPQVSEIVSPAPAEPAPAETVTPEVAPVRKYSIDSPEVKQAVEQTNSVQFLNRKLARVESEASAAEEAYNVAQSKLQQSDKRMPNYQDYVRSEKRAKSARDSARKEVEKVQLELSEERTRKAPFVRLELNSAAQEAATSPAPTIGEKPPTSPMIGAEPTQPAPAEGAAEPPRAVAPAPETAAAPAVATEREGAVGRTWKSNLGNATVVSEGAVGGEPRFLVKYAEGGTELVRPNELESRIESDVKMYESRQKMRGEVAAIKEQEELGKAKYQDFTQAMPPMQAKRTFDSLEKNVSVGDAAVKRGDLVQADVAEGATIVLSRDGKRRLQKPDGRFRAESQISKTAMDYADFLIKKKTAETQAKPDDRETDFVMMQPAPAVTTPPAPEAVTPAPEGIAVGNRIKLGKSPQTYVVEEVIPQTATERDLGEQYYSVRNERTGEVQVVEKNDVKPVKAKGARKVAADIRETREEVTPAQEENRYTYEQILVAAKKFFGGKAPANLTIVNDSTDPDYRFKAGYNLETGQIILNQAYLSKEDNIADNIAHELGHFVYGDPEVQAAFKEFWNALSPEQQAQADDIIRRHYSEESQSVQMEENQVRAFGTLIAENRIAPKWERFVNAVKTVLNRLVGTKFRLTDRGAQAVLSSAIKRFQSGERIIREMDAGILSERRGVDDVRYAELEARARAGDKEAEAEAQRMVDEAAKAAVERVDALDLDETTPIKAGEEVSRVIWGTVGDVIELQTLDNLDIAQGERVVRGVHFGDTDFWTEKLAEDYGRDPESATIIDITVADGDRLLEDTNYSTPEEGGERAYSGVLATARTVLRRGIDFVVSGESYINDDIPPSADPFTYDDAGNLIPLSQRFQPTTPDIRRMAVEAEPTVEPAAEAPQRKPRPTTIQRLIEATTGVKRKRDLLTINEKTALKDQLKLGAKKRRLDAAQQKEFVKDLTAQLREEAIRGRVKAPQLRAIVNKAMQVRFDNDASILSFLNYANKVIDNANYDRDLSDARKAVSRAKQLSKQKGVPADAQKILEKFSGIDPRQVDDPAEFAAVLNEFMAGYGDVLARDYIVIPNAEMDEYFKIVDAQAKEAQVDKEFQAMSNALNSELGKEGITDEEVAAILAMSEKDFVNMIEQEKQEARTEKQKKRAEAKENAINKLSGSVQAALQEYTNPDLTSYTRAILKDMQDIDLSQLDIGAKKEFVRAANGVLVNNTFFGAEKFSARAKGQMGAIRAAKDAKQKPRSKAMLDFLRIGQFRLVARATARKINLQLQSISDTFRNIAGKSGAAKLQELMGMGNLLRGMATADRAKAEFSEALLKQLQEIEKRTGQKVSDPQGSKSMGVAATLIQTFPDETEAEGIARIRKMIEEQIIIMENSYDDKVVEDAKLVRRALEDVSADSVAGILENLKKAYPANYEMLMFVKDVALPPFKPLFKEHDELFNNQTDNYENLNYLPLRFRQEGVTLEAKEELQGYWNRGTISPKQAPNSIKRKKYTTLPKDRMFDFNMLKNVLGSVNDQLDATYTNAAWEQVKAFLDSPEGEIALGGKDNLDFVTERLNILASSRTRIYTQANLGNDIADSIANVGRATGYGYALGGIGQIPKQYFSQMITGFVNVRDKSLMMKSAKDVMQGNAKDIMSLFSIGMRGDIIGGTKWSNQAEGNYGKLEKFYEAGKFPQAKDALAKLNNLWLYPLKISDTHAAQTSWLAYYRQYLQDNNLEFKGWETEAQLVRDGDNSRNEAGNYAEMMTDLYQGSSDPTRMAAFAQRGKGGYENLVKSIFLPFLSFVLQERMRMFSDYRDAVYGAGKEKTEGAKALAGAVASQVVFHTVRRFMLPVMMGYGASLIYAMLGVDMDEPDEDKQKEEAERKWRQFKGEVLSNIFVGGFGAITEKSFLTAINGSFYFIEKQLGSENVLDDEGEVMDYKKYVEKRSPFWQYQGFGSEADYGMLSITPGQFGDVMDRLEKMSNEEFMDSLTEEERKLILVAGLSEIFYTLRMNDADLNRMFRRMAKDVEEQAKEREKADKRLQQRYSSDR
jgi:hypothetical protein